MVRQCFVCQKYDVDNPDISFNSFPADINRRKLWLSILNIDQNKSRSLPKRPQICSEHFEEKDFHFKKSGRKFLNQDACPKPFYCDSVDDLAPHQQPWACLQQKLSENLSDSIKSSEGTLSGVESSNSDTETDRTFFVDEETMMKTPTFEDHEMEDIKIELHEVKEEPTFTHGIVTPEDTTQLNEDDSVQIKIEPHEVKGKPTFTHNLATPANNTQLDEDDSVQIKIEPHEDKQEPIFANLFEDLKQSREYILPNEYWSAGFIPGRNVVVFNLWDKTSSTYSSFKKVVILPDMSYKIFLGTAEIEVQDQPLAVILNSLGCVESLLKKVNDFRGCLGSKTVRVSDECQGFVPSSDISRNEGLAGYCLPCKLDQLEYNRKIKNTKPTVKHKSIKHKVSKLKTKLRKT